MEIPHNLDEWEHAARGEAALPGIAGTITDVIDRLIASGRLNNDPQQRAGPSVTNRRILVVAPSRRDSSDDLDDEDEQQEKPKAAMERAQKRPRNPFILEEADDDEAVEIDAIETEYNDYEFIDENDGY